jgi:hypothetical protein
MVNGRTLEEELKRISKFFNDLSIEEFNQMLIDCGAEIKEGFQLSESWRISNLTLEDVYNRSEALNKQGWFTVINDQDPSNDIFELIVYGRA